MGICNLIVYIIQFYFNYPQFVDSGPWYNRAMRRIKGVIADFKTRQFRVVSKAEAWAAVKSAGYWERVNGDIGQIRITKFFNDLGKNRDDNPPPPLTMAVYMGYDISTNRGSPTGLTQDEATAIVDHLKKLDYTGDWLGFV